MRAETGVMKFKGDWGGYFLRGDSVMGLVNAYHNAKNGSTLHQAILDSMISDMQKCFGSDKQVADTMKPYEECKL